MQRTNAFYIQSPRGTSSSSVLTFTISLGPNIMSEQTCDVAPRRPREWAHRSSSKPRQGEFGAGVTQTFSYLTYTFCHLLLATTAREGFESSPPRGAVEDGEPIDSHEHPRLAPGSVLPVFSQEGFALSRQPQRSPDIQCTRPQTAVPISVPGISVCAPSVLALNTNLCRSRHHVQTESKAKGQSMSIPTLSLDRIRG